jgi:hypothetical protein
MKRHYTNYFKGISHFKEYRTQLVTSNDLGEVNDLLDWIAANQDQFLFNQLDV